MENNNIINLNCDLEYNNYKKKLVKNIINQTDIIFQLFNNEFNENIVKLYILYKKNKLDDNIKNFCIHMYNFINDINNINHIDQYEFLNILLKFIKLYLIIKYINTHDKNSIKHIEKLINWVLITNNISITIDKLLENNIIVSCLINLNNIISLEKKTNNNGDEHIINIIINLSKIMCCDFFMYFSPTEIYRFLYKKLAINSDKKNPLNKMSSIIIKYKKHFILEYRNKYNIYIDLYSDVKNADISKYKINKNNKDFDELLIDLNSINVGMLKL